MAVVISSVALTLISSQSQQAYAVTSFLGDGGCPAGEIPDCNGNCAPKKWVGDGICDDGSYEWNGNPIYFNCEEFACDGGDCDCDGGGDYGACCIGVECYELTEEHCGNEGGKWFGANSICDEVDCDGGGGDCPAGEMPDCNGNCAPKSWIGDGICDDGWYEWNGNIIYFNCDEFDCDGGDCDCDGGGGLGACCINTECYELTEGNCGFKGGKWFGANSICDEVDCDGGGGDCPAGEMPDCNGNCAPKKWVGDGICDDGSYEWNGNPIYFNCEEFACDGGDCDCGGGGDYGACCIGVECYELTEEHCENEGGKWFGANSICDEVDCDGGGGDCPAGEMPWTITTATVQLAKCPTAMETVRPRSGSAMESATMGLMNGMATRFTSIVKNSLVMVAIVIAVVIVQLVKFPTAMETAPQQNGLATGYATTVGMNGTAI